MGVKKCFLISGNKQMETVFPTFVSSILKNISLLLTHHSKVIRDLMSRLECKYCMVLHNTDKKYS